jgi:protein-S-isoprenylcysteine O-methyltransferase Ste14
MEWKTRRSGRRDSPRWRDQNGEAFLSAAGYILVTAGWLVWFIPFPIIGWKAKTPDRQDHRARWGLILEVLAYLLLPLGKFWERSPEPWTATRALGRHLRFDAALSPDHELVRSGPYSVLRHPIYTSMLCLLLGTAFMIAPLPLFLAAIVIFIGGTEIRVRVEDGLLASRFGDNFREYRRSVSAYIPLVR